MTARALTSQELAVAMVRSHRELTGTLLAGIDPDQNPRDLLLALQDSEHIVLCHDNSDDPEFTFANRSAARLWKMDANAMIGMKSRLSAQPDARESRQEMLEQVRRDGYTNDYSGIRIASDGTRFQIANATVWNVTDGSGHVIGQAATFATWSPIGDD